MDRIRLIERGVWHVEQMMLADRPEKQGAWRPTFGTHGPRGAIYCRCAAEAFLLHVEKLDLDPEIKAADLGGGLGMAAFVLASCFKDVVVFEIDERLWMGAVAIQRMFDVQNVRFLLRDFMHEPLDRFGFVNFYQPFSGASEEDFVRVMSGKIEQVRPGTIVNSHRFLRPGLFKPEFFEPVYPRLLIGCDWEDPENDVLSDFYTFRRI